MNWNVLTLTVNICREKTCLFAHWRARKRKSYQEMMYIVTSAVDKSIKDTSSIIDIVNFKNIASNQNGRKQLKFAFFEGFNYLLVPSVADSVLISKDNNVLNTHSVLFIRLE